MGILYLGFNNLKKSQKVSTKPKVTQVDSQTNKPKTSLSDTNSSSPNTSNLSTNNANSDPTNKPDVDTSKIIIKPESEVNPIDTTSTKTVQRTTSLTLEQKAKADSVKQLVNHIKAVFATINDAKARPDKSTSGLIESNKVLIADLKILNKELKKMTFMPCAQPTFKKMHTGLNQFIGSLNDIKRSSFIQDNYIKNQYFQKAIDYYDARDSCTR